MYFVGQVDVVNGVAAPSSATGASGAVPFQIRGGRLWISADSSGIGYELSPLTTGATSTAQRAAPLPVGVLMGPILNSNRIAKTIVGVGVGGGGRLRVWCSE